eukprot:1147321-Pelagomonas_calceolata.AAC.2
MQNPCTKGACCSAALCAQRAAQTLNRHNAGLAAAHGACQSGPALPGLCHIKVVNPCDMVRNNWARTRAWQHAKHLGEEVCVREREIACFDPVLLYYACHARSASDKQHQTWSTCHFLLKLACLTIRASLCRCSARSETLFAHNTFSASSSFYNLLSRWDGTPLETWKEKKGLPCRYAACIKEGIEIPTDRAPTKFPILAYIK